MTQLTTEQQLEQLLETALDPMGYELVDLEYRREERGWVVRVFIDSENGVNLDDCVTVSRELGVLLEVEDPVPHAYNLEVSSPGMDRVLKKEKDFKRFCGQRIKVKTLQAIDPDGQGHNRKTFVGQLKAFEDGCVKLEHLDGKDGEIAIEWTEVERANLDPEF